MHFVQAKIHFWSGNAPVWSEMAAVGTLVLQRTSEVAAARPPSRSGPRHLTLSSRQAQRGNDVIEENTDWSTALRLGLLLTPEGWAY